MATLFEGHEYAADIIDGGIVKITRYSVDESGISKAKSKVREMSLNRSKLFMREYYVWASEAGLTKGANALADLCESFFHYHYKF